MTTVPIPAWTADGILPPVNAASPVSPERSPYVVSLTDYVLRFSDTAERRVVLDGLLRYRAALHAAGIVQGFQWLDGSFLEHVELTEGRAPNDIDVVSFYRLPVSATQVQVAAKLGALSNPANAKATLGHHVENGAAIHWVDVRRMRGPEPLRRKGCVHVRRGRASVEPSPSELQELFNVFGFVITEEQIVPGSSPGDVDVRAFRTFLERQGLETDEEPQPAIDADLRTRWVAREIEGETRLTVYGTLAFGKAPQEHLALQTAWIDLVAYNGTDRAADVILHGEAKGRLDEQVERAVGWLKALGIHERYEGIHRTESLVVPERAFREAIVNAVAHRDYAIVGSSVLVEVFTDRLDVTSPGTLPNHMTEATVLAGAAPRARNQLIAHCLLVSRLMERRGRGFPIMRKEMRAFNGTEPGLLSSDNGRFVRVTLRRSKE